MKFFFLAVCCCVLTLVSRAQDPASWKYSAKKIADKTYEVHLTASVQSSWHIYSQFTPEGGPVPTTIEFTKNPLVSLMGNVKEVGALHKKHEEVFGVDVKYFDDGVDFVQVVKLKNNIKTNVNGRIEYMSCDDQQCLPPKTVKFDIVLN